jgi:hypothetical protein
VSGYSPFSGRRPGPPRLDLIEVAWRMRAPSGRVLECGIYRTDFGYEARMGYSIDDLLASHRAADIEGARTHAVNLHDDAARSPKFTDIPNGDA